MDGVMMQDSGSYNESFLLVSCREVPSARRQALKRGECDGVPRTDVWVCSKVLKE